MQLSYPRIYDCGHHEYIGFPVDVNRLMAKCPACKVSHLDFTKRGDSRNPQKPHFVSYLCGGSYRLTVDLNGVPCWEGRCGQKLSQLVLAFPEEA